jgi:hypothetical protein
VDEPLVWGGKGLLSKNIRSVVRQRVKGAASNDVGVALSLITSQVRDNSVIVSASSIRIQLLLLSTVRTVYLQYRDVLPFHVSFCTVLYIQTQTRTQTQK